MKPIEIPTTIEELEFILREWDDAIRVTKDTEDGFAYARAKARFEECAMAIAHSHFVFDYQRIQNDRGVLGCF